MLRSGAPSDDGYTVPWGRGLRARRVAVTTARTAAAARRTTGNRRYRAHRIRLRGRLVLGEDDQPAGALGEALEHR